MAETIEVSVQNFLRGSEELKQLLDVEAVPTPTDGFDPDLEAGSLGPDTTRNALASSAETARTKRILAVVAHVDPYGDEQGCAFILRPKRQQTAGSTDNYVAEHAFPITSGFTIAMAQARRNTTGVNSATITAMKQPETEFTLTIHPGHDGSLEPIQLTTQSTHLLKNVLAECKRLKDIYVANNEPGATTPYTWMTPYVSQVKPVILLSEPQDLRHARRPLFSLLSDAFAGSPGDDALDVSLVREHWIRSQIETLYSAAEPITLKLRIGTFNVNGKMPSQDLSAWVGGTTDIDINKYIPPLKQLSPFSLGEMTRSPLDGDNVSASSSKGGDGVAQSSIHNPPHTIGEAENPDLIVLGFQELDLSAGALLYSTESTREDAWFTAALAGLGEKAAEYEKLASKQLVGMLLMVIVKRTWKAHFTRIQATSIGAGIMGLMGNKGAVALRLTLELAATRDVIASKPLPRQRPVVLTFVNAHLAAFDEMYEKRNADFHDISKRLVFDSGVAAGDGATSAQPGHIPAMAPLNVYQSDALFWMGDLNYRIDLADSDVRSLLSDEVVDNLPLLLHYDQLNCAIRTDKAFTHFIEHSTSHLPQVSYRFNSAALSDNLGYDLKRKPAWTDRVLHIPSHAVQVQQRTYECHREITMSDHRPVSATFELHMPKVDAGGLEALVHDLWKEVSHIEQSDDIPRVSVEPAVIDLGKIGYGEKVRQSVLVRNSGRVPLAYRFVPLSLGGQIHPNWLHVEPKAGLVRPGSHEELTLSVDVDAQLASELNLKPTTALDATLVLHTSLGKDSFLVVTAEYERSCFAMSITRLVRMHFPARKCSAEDLVPEDQAATAPKEIMQLVSWLMTHGSDVERLFLAPGDPERVNELRRALDVGEELPEPSDETRATVALDVGLCLLQFLEALPESLIPSHLHHACAESPDRETAFELLYKLPSASVNVWVSLTSFLHFICQQGTHATDSVRAHKLAALFAPILLRDPPSPGKAVSPVGKRRFVLYFIP